MVYFTLLKRKSRGLLALCSKVNCLEVLEPFIDEVIPEEEEEFDLSAMDYMDSVALELAI